MKCFLCVSACRNTPADADSRPKRTCGPSASVWLRLPGARRIRSTSSSARLRLWHVKTPAPHLHLQGGASIHPSPTVLHHTIILSTCLQQGDENGNKLVFIFLFLFFLNFSLPPPPLKLPWRTQFYFCCQTKGLNHKDLISSHSVLTTLIFLMFILFEWEMVYVQWEGWYVGRAGLLQKKKPHKHTKVCCEASGLHSVVRRN